MKCCLLVWAFTTCLQAFAGYWGRCMLFSFSGSMLPAFRPCWMLRGTSAVSLSGHSNTCSRGLLQDDEGDICCSPCLGLYYQLSDLAGYWGRCMLFSLSGPLLPAHRPLQDNGGEVCRLLVSSPVFAMASPWKFYLRLFGTNIQLSFWSQE